MRKTLILGALLALGSALSAVTPFASNLKGLKVLVLDINGDESAAKKAGQPFEAIYKQLSEQFGKAGIKVVSSGKQVPEGVRALPAELMLGVTTHEGLFSYALTLQAYEPMRLDKVDHLYVAWSSMTYGFAPKSDVKGQIKEQVQSLADAFLADWKSAKH